MRVKVCVTAKHIKNGVPVTSGECPVALALKDAGFTNPYVTGLNVYMHRFPEIIRKPYPLSRSVRRFIAKFDAKKKVKPFTFLLDLRG